MTKLLVSGILAATVLAGGTAAYAYQGGSMTNYVDEDGDGVCDNGYYLFVDEDGDGVCDNLYSNNAYARTLSYGSGAGYVDEDGDGICDNGLCAFVDEDGDGICDNIGLYGGRGNGSGYYYSDEDGDGVCDNIGLYGGNGNGSGAGYVDADGDGVCDNAGTNCIYGGVAAQDGTGRQLHGSGNGRG